ncbi:MAG: PKD domain-containing protein, partial [Saprospiraceae bacterium]
FTGIQAKHIIGGDMYYECDGNGNYTIVMNVYRDCNSDGAPYDSPGNFAVYSSTNPNTPIRQITANPSGILTVPPDNDPCFEISNPPCVQGATYTFSVNLPPSNNSYVISYQRCCRNNTINNISQPGSVGATYTVEITPEAQQLCNDSPTFNNFPPIVICVGESIDFDHGASDSEGDSLVYSFCSPLTGGGLDGSQGNPGNPNGPTGVQPIPPQGPPYNSVIFIAPTYTTTLPMGGVPPVSIDPQTGFITGVPSTLGQFVVGVCVQEYRNGVLIGGIRRDFQFNVINCDPVVNADIEEDVIIGDKEFLINLCGDFSYDFINESISLTDTVSYLWTFDLGNDSIFTSTDENVFVTFPDLGNYTGTLVVNPDFPCNDTAFIYVNVFPAINADFTFDYDTCAAAAVEFTDLSVTGAGDVVFWDWNFGDGNNSGEQNLFHEYLIPGNFDVELTVRDTNQCEDTAIKELNYFPAPESLVINLDGFVGCAPETVEFDNLSFPIDSTYTINWDFGDST